MDFYLVQRLESRSTVNPSRGFDGFFSLDYMGSSEFEWGAIPKALKSVREKEVLAESISVTIGGVTRVVHFVGHPGTLTDHAEALEAWSVGGTNRRAFWGKEVTYFPENFSGGAEDFERRTDAWWAIDSDVAWSLDPVVAEKLVAAFNSKPVTA